MGKTYWTEDEVRDSAKLILGFDKTEDGVQQGTGQITTFNQLGFRGCNDKPDGWYLPDDASKPAIILETKSEAEGVSKEKHVKELFKNIDVVAKKYSKTIGILYSGSAIRVFKNKIELSDASKRLENKNYYIRLCTSQKLDSNYIFEITQKINNSLHFKFGMTDLQDRMIFTACALVAQRYNPQNGLQKLKDMDYSTFHNWIYSALSKALEEDKKQNNKLDVLLEEYASVRMSITENQEAINDFIDNVCQIANLVNSDNWNGEDVMAIFFNEFNRYRGKAQAGQVFTPDHIASFMYRLIDVNMNDRVLDATCGSGTFLVKSMCNMIREAGGSNTSKAKQIKSEQLFGIEMYRKVYALACANMMIHKDGKTNLVQMDATSAEATEWIRKQKITKTLMNPPYERKYGCATIVSNVLDSVPAGTKCAFILPDKKMEKESKLKALLERHTLTTIIKLPENLFFGLGVTTSIFIFETGKPQNGRNIKGYYVADDGLETVKNKGRQDVHDKWPALEDYWVKAIQDDNDDRYNTRQLINPAEHLSYQMPEKPFELYEEDFIKTVMESYMANLETKVAESLTLLQAAKDTEKKKVDTREWREFRVWELFEKLNLRFLPNRVFDKASDISEVKSEEFNLPLVNAKHSNNGIMYYGRKHEWEYEVLTIDIVANGAASTGDVYAQPQETGVLYDAYLVKPKAKCVTGLILFFLSTVIQRCVKDHFGYDNKCTWNKVKHETILLPADKTGQPDWAYMEKYMRKVERKTEGMLNQFVST